MSPSCKTSSVSCSSKNSSPWLNTLVCFDVQKEPVLLPLSGEQFRLKSANTAQEARPDVSARSVWNNLDKVFFDVRIFHHGAKSNQLATVEAAFKKHEDEKKRVYNQRIMDVEKATFTPLVLSTHGGIGPEAEKFNKRLAALIAKKEEYSSAKLSHLLELDCGSASSAQC